MSALPVLARWLLALVDPNVREFVAGDLEETFRTDTRPRARVHAVIEALHAVATNPRRPALRSLDDARKGDSIMRTVIQDLIYGARILLRQPGYSLVIILTLALAIGANAVIFSFTNVLLIRPLPMKHQESLGWIFTIDPQRGGDRGSSSLPDFLDLRQSLHSFESIAAVAGSTLTMTGRGDAMRLSANKATSNLFEVWGLSAVAGRGFAPGDDAPGAEHVVVLSHQFWQRQFSGSPTIIGQALTLNGEPYTVRGVLTPEIEIGNLSQIDLWVPLTLDPGLPRDRREYRLTGRLRPGTTIAQASAEVHEVAKRLERDHPETNRGWGGRVASTRESITGKDTWVVLSLLMLVVGFVLLIACANIANLVLARATARRREIALRTALGASRLRVVRQLLTESVISGVLGGALGLGFAYAGLWIVKAAAYEPFFELVTIDRNVLLFTAALSLLTPFVFSLLPALQSANRDVNTALKEGAALTGGDVRGRRSRSILVVSQLALAMALLIVSGLFIRSMIAYARTPLGFDPSNILTLQVEIPDWRYRTDASVTEYYDRLLARIAPMPGVQSVGAIDRLPVLGAQRIRNLVIDGYATGRPDEKPWAVMSTATEAFFATARVPILSGRAFTPRDDSGAQPVAIVSRAMADRYLGGMTRAAGARIALDDPSSNRRWLVVVGVAGDVKRPELTGTDPEIYLPARQNPARGLVLMVRAPQTTALTSAVRGEVRAADADVAVYQMRTLDDAFNDDLSSSRILIGMFIAFAVLALILAAGGLYGVIAYSVSRRVQEIGIRMALGAIGADIRRLILRQTLVLMVIGLTIGLAGGALIARLSSSILFGVSAADPVTYSAVTAVLAFVALAAAYVPVRRATRIDPIVALRVQ
jgi:putative ABC transport system permease protein